jgi:hypothetical protein
MIIADKIFAGPLGLTTEEIPEVRAVYIVFHNQQVMFAGLASNLRQRINQRAPEKLRKMDGVEVYYWEFSEEQIKDARSLEENVQKLLISPSSINDPLLQKKLDDLIARSEGRNSVPREDAIFNSASVIAKPRFYLLIGGISGVLATLLLFSDSFTRYLTYFFNVNQKDLPPAAFISLLITVISFSFVYLQSGGRIKKDSLGGNENSDSLREVRKLRDEVAFISRRLNERIEDVEQEGTANLAEGERTQLFEKILTNAGPAAMREIFAKETLELRKTIEESTQIDKVKAASQGMVNRLRREISDLRLRANINLLIGMAITAGGIFLLWTTVSIVDSSELLKHLASDGDESNSKFLKNLVLPLIPRTMLVIFVEIFAYFFLQLYKSGLGEIKYFQNELTNIESRVLAVEFAVLSNRNDDLKSVFDSLALTERNFVLTKEQTTVELERAKAEQKSTSDFLNLIPKLLKK